MKIECVKHTIRKITLTWPSISHGVLKYLKRDGSGLEVRLRNDALPPTGLKGVQNRQQSS
jgi:hypothetical protein